MSNETNEPASDYAVIIAQREEIAVLRAELAISQADIREWIGLCAAQNQLLLTGKKELAEAKTVRMLTGDEMFTTEIEDMRLSKILAHIQLRFAAVNNLTVKEES